MQTVVLWMQCFFSGTPLKILKCFFPEHDLDKVVKMVVRLQKLTCWKVSIVIFRDPIFSIQCHYGNIVALPVLSLNNTKRLVEPT